MTDVSNDRLLQLLGEIYPPDRILSETNDLTRYQKDLVSRELVMPRIAVLPSTKQQVIDTVRLCNELDLSYVTRGAGSSLSGGALPVAGGIVIHLRDLNRILRLDPVDRVAVVEPGAINLHVSRAVDKYNLHYAPDPSSRAFCTIGGNVAFNSGGVHCLKYGMTSNHVLGIEAVLADGEVVTMGGKSLEGVGPDLHGLFVGSEGLFGIALEVTLRLIPQVESRSTLLGAYRSLEEAGNVVSSVIASGLLPGALEIMDPLAIEVTEAASHAGYPLDAGALVIVELEGEKGEVDEDFGALLKIVNDSGAYQIRTATDDTERAAIWKGRMAAFTAIRKVSANYIIQDGVVPRSRLGEALAEIEKLSNKYEIPVANVFHAGDGNLHPLILYEAAGCTAGRDKAEELAGEITHRCIEMGGSITGEHGVGLEKRDYLPAMFGPDDIALMRRLRTKIDPKSIANPGKMLEIGCDTIGSESTNGQDHSEFIEAGSVDDVREAVRSYRYILPIGTGTKPSLSAAEPGRTLLKMSGLRGIRGYNPEEFTFTALAGTPVAEITEELAVHNQYLPFDPPLKAAGATIAGAVASGLSGAGSYQYGGIRNFIIGADFVDGRGTLIRGGSKVVKNAAGFDFPKLMVGSLGSLGVLVALTFKVFPNQRTTSTLRVDYESTADAIAAVAKLANAPLTIMSVDIEIDADRATLAIRIGGSKNGIRERVARVASLVGSGSVLEGGEELRYWESSSELAWTDGHSLLMKAVTTPSIVVEFDRRAGELNLERRYSVGGNIAWISSPVDEPDLDSRIETILTEIGVPGVKLRGGGKPVAGNLSGGGFRNRVTAVLDPHGRFRSLA